MNYALVKHPAPMLLQTSLPVEWLEDISELLTAMTSILQFNRALGISAVQVGDLRRVIMVRLKETVLTMINPILIRTWGNKTCKPEMCLSYPGLNVPKFRHKFVRVEYLDSDFKVCHRKFSHLDAIVVQHEIEHLDGITLAHGKGEL